MPRVDRLRRRPSRSQTLSGNNGYEGLENATGGRGRKDFGAPSATLRPVEIAFEGVFCRTVFLSATGLEARGHRGVNVEN